MLAQNLDLNNSARVQLPASISYVSTCFIRVIARFDSHIYAGLNTGLLVIRSSPSLAPELCQDWARQQPHPTIWNNDSLLLCPMTRWQAIAGGRCCYRPDPQCYQGNPDRNNCWFHQARPGRNESSAVECYLSIGSNRQGAGAECCYDIDGMIITRGTGAGTDNRYEPTSSPVKHFFHDTLPYLQCCMMSTNIDMCRQYMFLRPPRRGSNTRDGNGGIWGDPHFGTMDALSYTFNGYGEYTYLAISNETSSAAAFDPVNQSFLFMSQIRTIPLSSSNTTVIRGFAARVDNQSISFTISRREKLLLYRENESIEFEDNINTIHFPELTLTRLDGQNNTRFSLAWNISVTIEITVIELTSPSRSLALNIGTSVTEIFRNRTYGLLGNYDGITDNDLRSGNGTIISSNASLEEIHSKFGVTWAIDPLTSLFHYESDQSAEYFQEQNRIFIPSFIDPTTQNNETIRTNCAINKTSAPSSWNVAQRTCYYDLAMTDDITFAQTSFQTANELQSIRNNQTNPPLFALSLPMTMNLQASQSVKLNISASSEYPTHTIELSVVHQPVNSTFDKRTGLFIWNANTGDHYLSIEARDLNTTLKSKYEMEFYVNGSTESIVEPNIGSSSQSNGMNYFIFIFSMLILVWN